MEANQIETQSFTKQKVKFYSIIVASVVAACVIVYFLIRMFTHKPTMPVDAQATIDSLNKVDIANIEEQKSIDSAIGRYADVILRIDSSISNLSGQRVTIHNYYYKRAQETNNLQTNQIDSFFKQRYNY